jgi:chromosome segregation ATPase
MDFFNGGNLLTLGIVAVGFLLFRYLDKGNRNISIARAYGKELKDELKKEFNSFTEDKAAALRNYGIILDADFKRAEALKKNIEEEIASLEKNCAVVTDLNTRIKDYESVLRDLDSWTEKVDENLRRIEAESLYVENAAEKVDAYKSKLNEISKSIDDINDRIKIETGEAVKETSAMLLQSIRTAVDNLKSTAEEIGRGVEKHREAISQAEAARKQNIENDMAAVNSALQKVISAATEHSSKIETELLCELTEAAEKRTAGLRQDIIEKITGTERSVDGKINEIEKTVQAAKDTWKNENAKISEEQQKYKNEWRQVIIEKVAEAEQSVNNKIIEVEKAVQEAKDNWENQNAHIIEEQKKYKDEWRQIIIEKVTDTGRIVDDKIEVIEKAVQEAKNNWESQNAHIVEEQRKYEEGWRNTAADLDALALDQRNVWQKMLDDSDAAIEEYRLAQITQMETLEGMAEDAGKLDVELRVYIENVKTEITNDFTAFENELKQNYKIALDNFDKSAGGIQNKIDGLEKEINELKSGAYEKVSGNLKEFEELINANLVKRSESINNQMIEWRSKLEKRFGELNEGAEAECRKIEHECGETLRRKKEELDANFDEEIKRVKDSFDDLGKSIGIQTERYEKSIKSLETHLQSSLDDARKIVDSTLKTEISRFELQNAERLKKHERGMEDALREKSLVIEERLNEITALTGKSYTDVENYKVVCVERFNEMDAAIENLRKRGKELTSESEERLAAVRARIEETASDVMNQRTEMLTATSEKIKLLENSIGEADRHIADFFNKTELIDKTIAVKKDVENKIEDLNADMEKLALQSIELSELKNQFEKIKRMEEDLRNKMTEFSIEQQRIERMEINFNRLLQTSQSVEDRLKQITGADDMLQEAQIKIRKLGEAMSETEEKYQRIEKKNQILEAANDGIEKNFKSLQESEELTKKLNGDIQRINAGIENIRLEIDALTNENEKAHDTVEKLSNLDQTINEIDTRIQNMQKARVWMADLETRLDEKYREVRQQFKLTDDIIKKQDDRIHIDKESSLPPGTRDDVIRLKKQGWTVDEIVKNMKISRAAVELILETARREK